MVSCTRFAVVVAAVTLLTSPAFAAPIRYNCDSGAGYFSEIEQFQAGPDYRVQGSFEANLIRLHPKYLPTATIAFESKDKSTHIGVQLMKRHNKKLYDATIVAKIGGERKVWSVTAVDLNTAVLFSLKVSKSGTATATLAGRTIEVPVSIGPDGRLSITCSTGGFEFHGLDWTAQEVKQ